MPSALQPGGVIAWIVIGLLAGAISGRLVRGRGYGCLIDIVVGIVGAFVGGFIISLFFPRTEFGFIGSLLVAIGGAAVLLILLRLITGGGHRRRA
ncbi:MAG: GlsB/YeaQ/YmgE family stress response membrane protein [Candidatus Dormibacteraeota bacterium]|nr:GlsB/YeaQ/YmgE family stress response membrane protein [Candidatus Dormibacteraeota bacterium]